MAKQKVKSCIKKLKGDPLKKLAKEPISETYAKVDLKTRETKSTS